jgi:hypothetical protein
MFVAVLVEYMIISNFLAEVPMKITINIATQRGEFVWGGLRGNT